MTGAIRDARISILIALFLSPPSGVHAAPGPGKGLTVAVLGDSRTDGCEGQPDIKKCRQQDTGFNEPVLSSLLGLLVQKKPAAVFFTGDLTLGLEREEEDGKLDPGAQPAAGSWARDFEYDPQTFQRMLGAFRKTAERHLGKIPFYPVVGNHDTVGPDAVTHFRRLFGLNHIKGGYREPSHLAYTVEMNGAVFVVLATDYYQSCAERGMQPACNLQEHLISQPQLAWLDGQLARQKGKRLFVLGHEPAFSPGNHKLGLDNNEAARNAFWAILKRRGVTAYLCSHLHELDISKHDDVWQIIAGGAGAPLDGAIKDQGGAPASQCTGGIPVQKDFADRSFFHYVLLNIPAAPAPITAEVHDCTDAVRHTVELK